MNWIYPAIVVAALSAMMVASAKDNATMANESKQIISKHKNVFTTPPKRTPANQSVDGPLLGNGDMGVAIGGTPDNLSLYLHKNDMWRLQHGYGNASPVGFGHLTLKFPGLTNASYSVTQDLYTAITEGRFETAAARLEIETYVAATRNLLIVELRSVKGDLAVQADLSVASGRGSETETGKQWGKRSFTKNVDIPSGCAAAWKWLESGSKGNVLSLPKGKTVTLVLTMDSLIKNKNYVDAVKATVKSLDAATIASAKKSHLQWWSDYWAKSYVSINDPVIEQHYYRSLYSIGSCQRDLDFPAAIFGWVTTDNPRWHGDYHLNYNHMAPFYGLARANRLEQADPHDTPMLDFLDRATWHCKEIFGYDGVMFPVGIGPKGIETTYNSKKYVKRGDRYVENKGLFFGQRTNGAYALVNMAPRWYTTYDPAYGKKIYPLVLSIATFWESYVTWDAKNNRFIIEKDSIHEGSGKDLNSCLSIGLVRNALLLAIDLSNELKIDIERQEKWNHILKHLAGYTFQEKKGKKVFRYAEKGTSWWKNNTLGIQQIYPVGQIHLDSDPKLLEVSRNTIDVMNRWQDSNGSNSFFPAAARVGYDPEIILKELRNYSKHTYPNGFQAGNPHGIENLSTTHNTINEMLCMGHKGVIRLFPVWPKTKNASFTNIRCWGAFLVTGSLKNGKVQPVTILSEKGKDCTMVNPWPGKSVQLTRNGKTTKTLKGERFTFKTETGESIVVTQD